MNELLEPFLVEGLNTYPQARATLQLFEEEIRDRLLQFAKSRRDWLPLQIRHKYPKAYAETGDGRFGYWLGISVAGLSPSGEPVGIDCGIWWHTTESEGRPIIYASFINSPKKLLDFQWPKGQDIRSFKCFGRTILYSPLANLNDVEKLLNRVLTELLKQLSETK